MSIWFYPRLIYLARTKNMINKIDVKTFENEYNRNKQLQETLTILIEDYERKQGWEIPMHGVLTSTSLPFQDPTNPAASLRK